jgi:hypothetical protein
MMKNALMVLSLLCCMVGCGGQVEVKKVVSDAVEAVPEFSLTWSEYPSWSAFGVAHELGILNGEKGKMSELEKKYNVDVVLKEADYDTCVQYYGTGTVDAACLTNMDTLSPCDGSSCTWNVLPTSTSFGGDAVMYQLKASDSC